MKSPVAALDIDDVSSVYGPVRSWRVGSSLGVDLLCVNSICSFNCTYCQLGFIQVRTNARDLFVPTDKLLRDLKSSRWKDAEVITFSGSGEPTLATNLGEAIRAVSDYTGKPILVLTNGTLLGDSAVRDELGLADRVFVKLDAATDATFRRVNRPVPGITLSQIVDNTARFRREFDGKLGIQMMFLPNNIDEVRLFGKALRRISPDEIQVNSPTRPYPSSWALETRGSHGKTDYQAKPLKPIGRTKALELAREIHRTSGVRNVVTVYGDIVADTGITGGGTKSE